MSRSSIMSAVECNSLEAVAEAIAADEFPGLAPGRFHAALDMLAERMMPSLQGCEGHTRLERFLELVYLDWGFRVADDYDDPQLQYLNCVLDTRKGSPVSLALLLVLLGTRLQVPLRGVAFPGHFLVRYDDDEPIFIDPASGALPLPAKGLTTLAAEELGVSERAAARELEAVDTRTFAVRMLQNLQRVFRDRGDHGRAFLVADRLFELTGSVNARADRGMHAVAMGAHHLALDDLAAFLADERGALDHPLIEFAADRIEPDWQSLN